MAIIPAHYDHVLPVAWNMRDVDVDEIAAASGEKPYTAVYNGFKNSSHCWTVMIENEPSIMFGVAPLNILGGIGVPWLLATNAASKVKRKFLTESKTYIDEMLKYYPVLMNFVDVRNEPSIRWLKWLGFDIMESIEYGVSGEPFHPFEMRAN